VIPELAAREHIRNIAWVVEEAIVQAGIDRCELDAIAVTNHPGLIPALAVGVAFAKGLAMSLKIPILGINHFLGHIYGAFLEQTSLLENSSTYPMLALVASGGHTALVVINEKGEAEIVGQSIDDAAGEAFDKAAKLLNLGYPGGPVIDHLAQEGNPHAYHLPRALTGANGKPVKPELKYCFSFSGVKTALLYTVHRLLEERGVDPRSVSPEEEAALVSKAEIQDLAASFQEAVVDVLVKKSELVVRDFKIKTAVICGGVACNSGLRQRFLKQMSARGVNVVIAPPKYCTDNAAMIGGLAYHYAKQNQFSELDLDVLSRARTMPMMPFTPNHKDLHEN
jgi:N6-L-threonylcarbamoyladenine synthase